MNDLSVKHLLSINDLNESDIETIFKTADSFKEIINRPIKKVPTLRDITIANLFLKIVQELNYLLNLQKSVYLQIF